MALSTISDAGRTDTEVFPAQCEWECVKGAGLSEKNWEDFWDETIIYKSIFHSDLFFFKQNYATSID